MPLQCNGFEVVAFAWVSLQRRGDSNLLNPSRGRSIELRHLLEVLAAAPLLSRLRLL